MSFSSARGWRVTSNPSEDAGCNRQQLPWDAYSVLWIWPQAAKPLLLLTILPHLALQNESGGKRRESKQFLEIHIFRKLRHSAFLGLASEQQ